MVTNNENNLVEQAVKREKTRQYLRRNPKAAEKMLSSLGVDTVELQRYQTLLALKIEDEFMKFQNRIFPELLGYGGDDREKFMHYHKIVGAVTSRQKNDKGEQLLDYCLVAPASESLGTEDIKRAIRLRVKFVPNPDKHAKDKILLQVETQDIPFPENVKVDLT